MKPGFDTVLVVTATAVATLAIVNVCSEEEPRRPTGTSLETAPPDPPRVAGTHDLFLVTYIGMGSCHMCRDPEVKQAVRRFRNAIVAKGTALDVSVTTRGIALDWDLVEGLELLRDLGPWHEVMIGNNWFGLGAQRHIWEEGEEGVVPQVVVSFQEYRIAENIDMQVRHEIELLRLIGGEEIQNADLTAVEGRMEEAVR